MNRKDFKVGLIVKEKNYHETQYELCIDLEPYETRIFFINETYTNQIYLFNSQFESLDIYTHEFIEET